MHRQPRVGRRVTNLIASTGTCPPEGNQTACAAEYRLCRPVRLAPGKAEGSDPPRSAAPRNGAGPAGQHEHGRPRRDRAQRFLQQGFGACQESGRQPPPHARQPEEGRGSHPLHGEARRSKRAADGHRRMVEVMSPVCHGSGLERRPGLATKQPARDGFQVSLVGELQDERPARANHPTQFREDRSRILEVMEHPDAYRRVEVAGGVWAAPGRCRASPCSADCRPGARVLPPREPRTSREATRPRSRRTRGPVCRSRPRPRSAARRRAATALAGQSGRTHPRMREQPRRCPDRRGLRTWPAPGRDPRDRLERCGSRGSAWSRGQDGLAAPTARRWTAKSSALPDQPQSHRTTLVRALYSSMRCDFTGRRGFGATAVRTGRAMVPPPAPNPVAASTEKSGLTPPDTPWALRNGHANRGAAHILPEDRSKPAAATSRPSDSSPRARPSQLLRFRNARRRRTSTEAARSPSSGRASDMFFARTGRRAVHFAVVRSSSQG